MKKNITILLIFVLSIKAFASDRFVFIERDVYSFIEYKLLKSDSIPVFILNQPYLFSELDKSYVPETFIQSRYAKKNSMAEDGTFALRASFNGQGFISDESEVHPGFDGDGFFSIGSFLGVNRLYESKLLQNDPDYHGDKSGWATAYFTESYGKIDLSDEFHLYAGRMPRNYGIPNEYSLFLSDNPYPYDHFGISGTGSRIKYSFYVSRLNNMIGRDTQGSVIPIGETVLTQRFMSFQSLDMRFGPRFHLSFREATLYGGPNQTFEGAYLNPMNFFYLSQRNQRVQMNGSWQVNLFYHLKPGIGFYLDFYIDDLIVNNTPGIVERDIHDDRLGVMTKISVADLFPHSLTSLRYVRVWNETYVTFRNFETFSFFNKGLGYPYRSHESIKLQTDYFKFNTTILSLSLDFWRQGDRKLTEDYHDFTKVPFPASPVTQGLDIHFHLAHIWKAFELRTDYSFTTWENKNIDTKDNGHSLKIVINYNLNFIVI